MGIALDIDCCHVLFFIKKEGTRVYGKETI